MMLTDKKIILTQDFDLENDQLKKLETLGEVKIFKEYPMSAKDWLERVKEADIFCSGSEYMSTEVYKLSNKLACIPMVGYSWLDIKRLKKNNIVLANCPGCNKYAVAEWIVYMSIELTRRFSVSIKTKVPEEKVNFNMVGLKGKEIVILGRGNIGSLAGNILRDMGANVSYFGRGDNLEAKAKNADMVINCLSTNPTTKNILNQHFFGLLKQGVYFITITTEEVYDVEAMIQAIDEGTIAGAASDASSIRPGDTSSDTYRRLSAHPKVVVTPHIASFSDVSRRTENDMMIKNIESYLKGSPINICN